MPVMGPLKQIIPAGGPSATRFGFGMFVGMALTVITAVLLATGVISRVERTMLDWRFQHFAYFNPQPSDRVVHIDIDDHSLDRTARWPWPRSYLAHVTDELRRAGAKVIAYDLIFDQPQDADWRPAERGESATAKAEDTALVRIDHDAAFARAVDEAGNVLLPVYLEPPPKLEPVTRRVLDVLAADITADAEEIALRLELSEAEQTDVAERLATLKQRAIRKKLFDLLDTREPPSLAEIEAMMLPGLSVRYSFSAELELLREEYQRVRAMRELSRRLPPDQSRGQQASVAADPKPPIPILARAAVTTGDVHFTFDDDRTVRTIALWRNYEGKLFPHLSFAAACLYLDVPLHMADVGERFTVIPRRDPDTGVTRRIRIPMLGWRPGDSWTPHESRVLIPWPSNAARWEMLFAAETDRPRQHFPIGRIVEARRQRRDIEANEGEIDRAILAAARTVAPGRVEPYREVVDALAADDRSPDQRERLEARRIEMQDRVLEEAGFFIEQLEQADELDEPYRKLLDALTRYVQVVRDARAENAAAAEVIRQFEGKLRALVNNTICLIGWTATGSVADFVPTSINPQTPGVVVHGALLNGILTEHFIARGPLWLDIALTLLLGAMISAIAARFAPIITLVITAAVVSTYFVINGLIVFDWSDYWLAAAGPIVAAGFSWAGVTVFRLVAEQRERARITRQFKNYVAPELVDYLVDHPQLVRMDGESRELSCTFSDIAGFTSISERLGPEDTARLLNRLLAVATDTLMDHRAFVNKYLGDGIMAFWGAPVSNPRHAHDSCTSVLACIEAIDQLNRDPEYRDMPNLFMRVGVSTGRMMVGDFGAPPRRSDYTVMGDAVNLASRLEQANKQFGTQILISAATFRHVRNQMLTRPIGRIVVVGKTEYEEVYELLATQGDATDEQRELAGATAAALTAYQSANFEAARERFEQLAERFGRTKLIEVYLEACGAHAASPPDPETWDGTIVLTEK